MFYYNFSKHELKNGTLYKINYIWQKNLLIKLLTSILLHNFCYLTDALIILITLSINKK